MSIDIFEGRTKRLSIPEPVFVCLAEAQRELRKQTGLHVDPYGKTSLSPEHAMHWLSGLQRVLPSVRHDARVRKGCQDLISLLADAIERRQTIVVEGE